MEWSGGRRCILLSVLNCGERCISNSHSNEPEWVQVVPAKAQPWHFPQNSCTGMMMWERLWMLCCLRAETLQGLKGKWGISREGMGGDLWANATQTHISASLGKDLAINPSRGSAEASPGRIWINHTQHGWGIVGHWGLVPQNAAYHAHNANRDVAGECPADRICEGIFQISVQCRCILACSCENHNKR